MCKLHIVVTKIPTCIVLRSYRIISGSLGVPKCAYYINLKISWVSRAQNLVRLLGSDVPIKFEDDPEENVAVRLLMVGLDLYFVYIRTDGQGETNIPP